MNFQFQNKPEFQQRQSVQSFYEPALMILNELFESKRAILRSKNYDENNAAIPRTEFREVMAYRFRITIWLATQIETSLIKANLMDAFGGYVKPNGSEVKP